MSAAFDGFETVKPKAIKEDVQTIIEKGKHFISSIKEEIHCIQLKSVSVFVKRMLLGM